LEEENGDLDQPLGSEKSKSVGIHSLGQDMCFPLGKSTKARTSGVNTEGETLSLSCAAGASAPRPSCGTRPKSIRIPQRSDLPLPPPYSQHPRSPRLPRRLFPRSEFRGFTPAIASKGLQLPASQRQKNYLAMQKIKEAAKEHRGTFSSPAAAAKTSLRRK